MQLRFYQPSIALTHRYSVYCKASCKYQLLISTIDTQRERLCMRGKILCRGAPRIDIKLCAIKTLLSRVMLQLHCCLNNIYIRWMENQYAGNIHSFSLTQMYWYSSLKTNLSKTLMRFWRKHVYGLFRMLQCRLRLWPIFYSQILCNTNHK